ncbi:MAG: tryptophan synthase subunit alpha, partial [Ruaniaceae bacterium]|nr:tryptophan synthase subunit alpha [Ruaniaceae bacterium]
PGAPTRRGYRPTHQRRIIPMTHKPTARAGVPVYLTDERLAMTAKACRGFVYAASTMGVTGERATIGGTAETLVTRCRAAGADRVAVGLGVSKAAHAREVGRYADGVIVGSALLRALGDGIAPMRELAAELAVGAHSARE